MERFKQSIHEFFYTLLAFPRAWRFMIKHRLWEGLRQYGWVARSMVVIGIFGAAYVIFEAIDWFGSHADAPLAAMMSNESLVILWFTELMDSFSEGLLNWVTLVLLEVVIYHFMRRTLKIILKKNVENAHTFKPFLDAQIRMIFVSGIAVIAEAVILNVVEIFHDGLLFWAFSLFVRATMLGYVIADNYNEQFGLSIDQSRRNLYRDYIGICFGLGLPLLLMLKIPLFGTVLGPLVTSVTAAIVLREKSDLHIVGYQMNEEELAKAEKKAAREARKLERKEKRKRKRTVN